METVESEQSHGEILLAVADGLRGGDALFAEVFEACRLLTIWTKDWCANHAKRYIKRKQGSTVICKIYTQRKTHF